MILCRSFLKGVEIPESLQGKLSYEPSVLYWRGEMSDDEQADLLALSSDPCTRRLHSSWWHTHATKRPRWLRQNFALDSTEHKTNTRTPSDCFRISWITSRFPLGFSEHFAGD